MRNYIVIEWVPPVQPRCWFARHSLGRCVSLCLDSAQIYKRSSNFQTDDRLQNWKCCQEGHKYFIDMANFTETVDDPGNEKETTCYMLTHFMLILYRFIGGEINSWTDWPKYFQDVRMNTRWASVGSRDWPREFVAPVRRHINILTEISYQTTALKTCSSSDYLWQPPPVGQRLMSVTKLSLFPIFETQTPGNWHREHLEHHTGYAWQGWGGKRYLILFYIREDLEDI